MAIPENMKLPEEDKIQISVGDVIKYGSLLGVVSTALSVTYDFAYFLHIDTSLFSLLSFNDHVSAAIPVFAAVFFSSLVTFCLDPPWVQDDKSPIKWNVNQEWINRPTWEKNVTCGLVVLLMYFYAFKFSPKGTYIYYLPGTALLAACVQHSLLERSGIKDVFAPVFRWANIFTGCVLLSFFLGLDAGYSAVNSPHKNETTLLLQDGTPVVGDLLRSFPSGIVFKSEKSEQIAFYRAANIQGLSILTQKKDDYIYRGLRYACGELKIPSAECSGFFP